MCELTVFKKNRVTVVKDRDDRTKSTGVAFVMYVRKEDAVVACKAKNGATHNGRTLKVKVATDNGRSKEFIKKRVYTNKSKCFECGVCASVQRQYKTKKNGNIFMIKWENNDTKLIDTINNYLQL